MNVGLTNRDLFGTVSSWSGYFEANTPSVEGPTGSAGWLHDSPLDYFQNLRPSIQADPIRLSFYVGKSDRFLQTNLAFDRLLTSTGVPHRFRLLIGSHDWYLWRSQLDSELSWIGRSDSCRVPVAGV